MFAKFGLILIVLAFGAVLFAAGALAPESVRVPIASTAEKIVSASAAAKTPTLPTKEEEESAAAPKAIPYQELLIPTPLPPAGQYALQLGLYPDAATAESSMKRVRDYRVPIASIAVLDQNNERWIVVAAGRYGSPDEARAARITLSRELNLTQALPIVRLPEQPAAASTSPTPGSTSL